METYKNLKKGTKIGLIISAVLLLAVLVNNLFGVVQAFNTGKTSSGIMAVTDIVFCALIILYTFFGYQKPHGNMLKILFFAFAMYLALQGTLNIAGNSRFIVGDLCILAALLIAYVAGRLHKIEKNKFILIFVGLLILAKTIMVLLSPFSFDILRIIGRMSSVFTFAALSFTYVARYEEHKAAGLADKADA